MFKVGEWFYTLINVIDDDFTEARVAGFLFMAECEGYIMGVPGYADFADMYEPTEVFTEQLEAMCEFCAENDGCDDIYLFRKDLCFSTKAEAEQALFDKLTSKVNKFKKCTIRTGSDVHLADTVDINTALDKLERYEKSGLTPEEIEVILTAVKPLISHL